MDGHWFDSDDLGDLKWPIYPIESMRFSVFVGTVWFRLYPGTLFPLTLWQILIRIGSSSLTRKILNLTTQCSILRTGLNSLFQENCFKILEKIIKPKWKRCSPIVRYSSWNRPLWYPVGCCVGICYSAWIWWSTPTKFGLGNGTLSKHDWSVEQN